MELTKEQAVVLYKILNDIRKGCKHITLGGFAGVGKTTMIRYLINFLKDYGACAFTGRASMVLRQKKIPASTIHSLIYQPSKRNDGTIEFILRPYLNCNGIIVDESSMISEEIYNDLISFELPIIWVGDHGQLEPVGTEFNLMKDPMYKLEKIHRYAGEIAKFAQWLRMGRSAASFEGDGSQVKFTSVYEITPEQYTKTDQIICAYNKTRVKINDMVRNHLGYKNVVEIGEKVICLQNNSELGLYNGLQGYVTDLQNINKRYFMDLENEYDEFYNIHYDRYQFGQEKSVIEWYEGMPNPFDYAYCITGHKSQGGEWNDVTVIEQRCKNWSHRRWAYTTASRAKESLTWVLN